MKVSASKVASANGSCSARPATSRIRSLIPASGDVALALLQHLLGQVHADHAGPGPRRELERDAGRPRGDIEHHLARRPGLSGRPWPAASGRSARTRASRPAGRTAAGAGRTGAARSDCARRRRGLGGGKRHGVSSCCPGRPGTPGVPGLAEFHRTPLLPCCEARDPGQSPNRPRGRPRPAADGTVRIRRPVPPGRLARAVALAVWPRRRLRCARSDRPHPSDLTGHAGPACLAQSLRILV